MTVEKIVLTERRVPHIYIYIILYRGILLLYTRVCVKKPTPVSRLLWPRVIRVSVVCVYNKCF